MNPKISVIVPIYKAEKYLHRCIDSVLAQTFTDFELILIDDGSPDGSGAICDEYAKKDKRVKVIHKENGGVTAARADGVKNSLGEFITFVDADDTIPINTLKIYNNNISNDFDIIKGSFNSIGKEDTRIYNPLILNIRQYRSETIFSRIIYPAPWGALIRRSIFNELTFNIPRNIIFGEDAIMNIRLSFTTNKNVKVLSDIVYNYIQHTDSCALSFVQTYSYFKERYKYVLDSIPKEYISIYLHELIDFRLAQKKLLQQNYVSLFLWKKDLFHRQLLNDIKKSKYKLSTLKIFILNFSDPISNYIYLSLYKIFKKIVVIFKNKQ